MRHRVGRGRGRLGWAPQNWAIWRELPSGAIAWLLLGELAAVVIMVASYTTPTSREWAVAGLLCAATLLHGEFVIGLEHIRQRMTVDKLGRNLAVKPDLSTVWTFAAALLLPVWLAGVVVFALEAHTYVRINRPLDGRMFRPVFAGTTIVLATAAVHGAENLGLSIDPWDGAVDLTELGALACLGLVYLLTQFGLMATVIALVTRDLGKIRAAGTAGGHAIEVTSLCLGVLLANLLGSGLAWTAMLMAPALLLLNRGTTEEQLDTTAADDAATSLLNTAAWHRMASGAVRRAVAAGQDVGLLVVDIDQFHRFNDENGFAAGDRALAAVGHALHGSTREGDVVGRLGPEEFAVLAPAAGADDMDRLARRVVAAIADVQIDLGEGAGAQSLGLTASTGMGMCPLEAVELHDLLAAADRSLRLAKEQGPSSVGVSPAPPGADLLRRRAPDVPRPGAADDVPGQRRTPDVPVQRR